MSDQENQPFKDSYNESQLEGGSRIKKDLLEQYNQLKNTLLQSVKQESQLEIIRECINEKLLEVRNGKSIAQSHLESEMIAKEIESLYEQDKIVIKGEILQEIKLKTTVKLADGQEPGEVMEYKVYKRRYIQVIIFALVQMLTCLLYSTTSPIANQLVQIYNTSSSTVNLNMELYLLGHPCFTFVASFLIEKYGAYLSMTIGCLLSLICVFLRLLHTDSEDYITILIIAQVIGGIGRPFIVNCQSKVATKWFGPSERNMITSLLSFNVLLSSIIGSLIPGILFGDYSYENDNENFDEGKKKTRNLMLIEFFLGVICTVPFIILGRNEPPTPPSYAASIKKTQEKFIVGIKKLFSNKNFNLLLAAYTAMFGGFKAFSIVSSYIFSAYGQNSSQNSYIQISPAITGFTFTVVCGILIKKYRCYKLFMSMGFLGSSLGFVVLYLLLQTTNFWAIFMAVAFVGIFAVPPTPVMIEYGIEVTFPLDDALPVGILFAGGQLGGMLIGVIVSSIVEDSTQKQANFGLLFFIIMYALSSIFIYFTSQDLRRYEAEKNQKEIVQESLDALGIQKIEEKPFLSTTKYYSQLKQA